LSEANTLAKELTTKKEQKAFEIAKQYNRLGSYNLTVWSLRLKHWTIS